MAPRHLLLCLCAVVSLAAFVSAGDFSSKKPFEPNATLYLKDGSRLAGRLIQQNSEEVVFETEGGRVTYPQSRVKKVEFFTPGASAPAPAAEAEEEEKTEAYSGPLPDDILRHEPSFLEPVRLADRHRLDFGAEMAVDMFHPEGVDSSDFNVTYLRLLGALGYRFAPNKKLELSMGVPFLFQLMTYGGTSGVLVEDDSSAGLGQVSFAAKTALSKNFGVKGFLELATGDADDVPATGEGNNLGAMLLAETSNGPWGFHAGLGRIVKTEYDRDFGGKRDPGDVTALSLALTVQGKPRASRSRFGGSRALQVGGVLELNTYMVADTKAAGTTVADTGGTATNLVLGLNIGSQTGSTTTVFKTGLAFGVGEEGLQSFDAARGAGDFLYFGSISTRWGGRP
ncbi:MAG: hypothetical protein ACT4O3_06910 [Elusimicrobiota bacterium]